MASTSASSVQKSFKYDVFLSFRGEDTRNNFVDHLYHALQQKGINTYKDDEEIKKGKSISEELIGSIENSRFYIVVFSKNYASSSWCLDELVKIMECQKANNGHTAYPVFYDVEPTEVRKQSGAVGEAFAKHNEEGAGKWRDALREAADLAGWELKSTIDGHEIKFIHVIVEEISRQLSSIYLSVDEKLVGMETRVKSVLSSLETNVDDFRMIGIKGIGGGGKTTLARVVFDQISFMFEGSSFVENVREASKNPLFGLKSLQKQVLSDVLNDKDKYINVTGVYEGKKTIKQRIGGRKVLIVLDDVDHIDQLEALAGEHNWFKPGSRIIITTREGQVLVAHGVPKNLILDVNLLSHKEASCLFNKYAFGRVIPIQGYDMLSDQVVRYAAGLPLTLKVLGSFLRGKDELEWTDALERLKRIPLKETLEILELSYKSLEEDYKEIFLDVACLLKGWHEEEAFLALESRGFHARNGIRVLAQKSLITISATGFLSMHDHIEEMGKNIVRRLHPNEPSRHSRLWNQDEIRDILVKDKLRFPFIFKVEKTNTYLHEATRCIQVWRIDPIILMKGLRKMKELRFLDVMCRDSSSFTYHGGDSLHLPNSLQYLHWDGYPFKYLPKTFQANNLVGLRIDNANINQLWKGNERKVIKKLRFIDLCLCQLRSFDIDLFPSLERLSLVGCRNLVKFHIRVENFNLRHLKFSSSIFIRTLNLERARNLELLYLECDYCVDLHFPVENLKYLWFVSYNMKILNLMRAQNLKKLNLSYCDNLLELHMPKESPELETFEVSGYNLKILNLIGAENLEVLNLLKCDNLVELHMPIEISTLKGISIKSRKFKLPRPYLADLALEECEILLEFHIPVDSPKLKTIDILCSRLKNLSITRTNNIARIDLDPCEDLLELYMHVESPTINIRGSGLKTLNLTWYKNLEMLYLEQCEDLVELHMPIESIKLKSIIIRCSKLRTLNLTGRYQNLQRLELDQCVDLVNFHMPFESPELKSINIHCSKLRILNLTGWYRNLERVELEQCEDLLELCLPIACPKLKIIVIRCSKLRTLDLTGRYQNLERLELEQCEDLLELHMPNESPKLKIINIRCSKLRTLNLTGTWNLERLELEQCDDLVEVHMPIERSDLKSINISCSKLITLHLGVSPYLERLDLHDCFNLVEFHALVGCLSGSIRFKPFFINHRFPMVGSLAELYLTARSLGICPLHPENNMPKFHFECKYMDLQASSNGNLKKLITGFGICACTNLASLSGIICDLQCLRKLTLKGSIPEVPRELSQLKCLEELALLSTNIEHLPDSMCMLKHLKLLQLRSCWLLKQLPEDLGRLECLEELRLTDCPSLRDIPNSISEIKGLKYLHLTDCSLVTELPKEIGLLKCLKELNIEGTGISDIPESILQLEDLRFFL